MNKEISNEELQKFNALGVNTNTKRFKKYYKKGYLNNVDENFINEVQSYFKQNLGKKIDPICHIAYSNFTGIQEREIVPASNFRKDYLWVFNDRPMTDAYLDKNINDFLFDTENQVYTVIRRVRGHYFDHYNNELSEEKVLQILLTDSPEYIIKPSDTNNGVGIKKIVIENDKLIIDGIENTLKDIEDKHAYNYLIQRVVSQHQNMAYPHPSSVNTLRMVTLRWAGEIHHLYTFTRFGVNNDVKDNAGAGGLSVGVNNDGTFMGYGIRRLKKVNHHPTTKININEFKSVPNYYKAVDFVKELHKNVLHHDYVSWDIAINKHGEPVLIESNFFGSSFLNQIALEKPTFGDMNTEVLQYLKLKKQNINKRNVKIRISGQRLRKIKKLRNRVKENESKIESLEKELEKIKLNMSKKYE